MLKCPAEYRCPLATLFRITQPTNSNSFFDRRSLQPPPRYDSEGRLTNVTYPTGMVTSLHREIERSINIDIESSSRDDDVTVITNLSSVEASYTVVQGKNLRSFIWITSTFFLKIPGSSVKVNMHPLET